MHTTCALKSVADILQPTDSKLAYCGILQGDASNLLFVIIATLSTSVWFVDQIIAVRCYVSKGCRNFFSF